MKTKITKRLMYIVSVLLAVILSLSALASCTVPTSSEEAATLEGIAVTTAPSKTEYTVGEQFAPAGMVVTATYSDETSKPVTSYTYAPTEALKESDTQITVSYEEGGITKTAVQAITVSPAAALVGIEITTAPVKTEYVVGETFAKAGMIVTAKYDNQTSRVVTSYTWSPAAALALEDKNVIISYTENGVTKTAEQAITVADVEVKSIAIASLPSKMSYHLGDTFEPDGLTAKVTYTNGTSKTVDLTDPNLTVEPNGALHVNDTAVKVSYEEDGVKVTSAASTKITISAAELTEANYAGVDEQLFSNTECYEAEGSKITVGTWSSNGNTFNRLRADSADSTITFSHDFSDLSDKSLAGLRVIMCDTRAGTVIRISTDNKETWTTIAQAGQYTNMIPADYKHPSATIDGKQATDPPNGNVYYCYYNIGKYMTEETGRVYIQFSFEDFSEKGWVGPQDVLGADLMHSIAFYDKLDIGKLSGEVTLTDLTVKTNPDKTEYYVDDIFDPTGLTLEAVWSDGTATEITSGYTYEPDGSLSLSDSQIVVSYSDNFASKDVIVGITVTERPANLESIAVTVAPDKTTYTEGQTFNTTGMVVTANYDDGTSTEITGYTVLQDALSSDMKAITISYNGKETTQEIKVLQTALKDADMDVDGVLMFTDENNYTLSEKAYVGVSRYFTDEDGTEAKRLRANTVGEYIDFVYTFKDGTDLSQAGFMFYCIDTRMCTAVYISTDGETWTTLAKAQAGDTRVPADWKETANNIVSTKGGTDVDKDGNLKRMYYNIGSYLNGAKTVYIRLGGEPIDFSIPGSTNKEGADIFGCITFYSRLDLSKVK
jgi:hypothetical protein